jgi:3-oxoacyl-[acyl-carrier-protein] synthase II
VGSEYGPQQADTGHILDRLDPTCDIRGLVANEPREVGNVKTILNMSFGMLGINSAVVVRALRA